MNDDPTLRSKAGLVLAAVDRTPFEERYQTPMERLRAALTRAVDARDRAETLSCLRGAGTWAYYLHERGFR